MLIVLNRSIRTRIGSRIDIFRKESELNYKVCKTIIGAAARVLIAILPVVSYGIESFQKEQEMDKMANRVIDKMIERGMVNGRKKAP